MPRRTLYPEHKTNMKKPIPDEMFTNLRAGRSRKAFTVKEPNNNRIFEIELQPDKIIFTFTDSPATLVITAEDNRPVISVKQ